MKIAIVGSGFCGLATAWHFTQRGYSDIVLFDRLGIGHGASGVSAGLLHPYAGAFAKKSLQADEGLAATLQLLKISEVALGESPIISRGLFRLAVTEEQKSDFATAASLYPDVHWLSAEECQLRLGIPNTHPGIFIDSAIAVDSKKYLQGLFRACEIAGVILEKKTVNSLRELDDFDRIIVTAGAYVKNISELSELPITRIKGQAVEFAWPNNFPMPLYPISSQAYVLVDRKEKKCVAGATYERYFTSEDPDLQTALDEILPKLHNYLPEMTASLALGCRAGIRASAPKHQPLMKQINEKTWVLTGMGSKGLLYHALYAERLVLEALSNP
jgi:glycine/D-amino acid oxidase-like deaminating enzyme